MNARQNLDQLTEAAHDRQLLEKYARLHRQGRLTQGQAKDYARLLEKWSSL